MGKGRAGPPALGGQWGRLRRADRIRSGKDFRRLQKQGRRCVGAHLVVLCGPGWDQARMRLGLTVSRQVGGAVARNRVKRRVREWFRCERQRLPQGKDLIVIARRGAAELETHALWNELAELCPC